MGLEGRNNPEKYFGAAEGRGAHSCLCNNWIRGSCCHLSLPCGQPSPSCPETGDPGHDVGGPRLIHSSSPHISFLLFLPRVCPCTRSWEHVI